jgi:endonuclease III
MELHTNIKPIDIPNVDDGYRNYFDKSLEFTKKNYLDTYHRILSTKFEEVTQEFFFKEYVWVVHATGFSAKAVSKFIDRLFTEYGEYDSIINYSEDVIVERVRKVVNNPQKIKAVYSTAKLMDSLPWVDFKKEYLSSPEKMVKLPYIGKITCYHLGRNIGLLDCVKPDLHLERLASYWKFQNCIEMCRAMQKHHEEKTKEYIPLGIIDLALWYGSSSFSTTHIRKPDGR